MLHNSSIPVLKLMQLLILIFQKIIVFCNWFVSQNWKISTIKWCPIPAYECIMHMIFRSKYCRFCHYNGVWFVALMFVSFNVTLRTLWTSNWIHYNRGFWVWVLSFWIYFLTLVLHFIFQKDVYLFGNKMYLSCK